MFFYARIINMDAVLSNFAVSVTDLKRNYAGILKEAEEGPIAVLNHNRPEAYLLSAAHYERLMSHVEDLEDAQLARERAQGPFVEVALSEL
jgi:antitoxin StbD